MQLASDRDHVSLVIPVRETSAEKDPAHVDVECDVAALHISNRDAEVPLDHLHSHGCLLLPDSGEAIEPQLKLGGCRQVRPDPLRIAAIFVQHDLRSLDDPLGDRPHVSMKRWRPLDRPPDGGRISCNPDGVEVP